MMHRSITLHGFQLFSVALLLSTLSSTCAFMSSSQHTTRYSIGSSSLYAATKQPAEFEFQELNVQLQAMQKAGIPSRDLQPAKRIELESYVRKIANERPSLVPLEEIGGRLPQTRWRLGFSTEGATLGDLPRDATVMLDFEDDTKMDYVLQFSKKTFGLNRLVAKSTYEFDSGTVNPGLVTFVYNQITTDVFGLSNLPVGFFGLLKGRANYVESRYFDGTIWIERGYSPEGEEYYNVYLREKDDNE